MVRTVLGVLAGVAVGVVTVLLIEAISGALYPPPSGVDLTDPAQLKSLAEAMPLGAKLIVLTACVAGTFTGTTTALLVATRRRIAGWVVGGLMLVATIANLASVPTPAWQVVAELVLVPTAAWLAVRLFGRPAAV